ncbi:MAG: adenylate/guanylate cyclase domain-containing protein [Burkholderiales bacterium]
MNPFQKLVAIRIAAVSVLLAVVASPAAWFVAREKSEDSIIALAMEESHRVIDHYHATRLDDSAASQRASDASKALTGGLFDIAEIYDRGGRKIGESLTPDGASIETLLPHHGIPSYTRATYDSFTLKGGIWVMRVFVPLRATDGGASGDITGYFEGVRIVPAWQHDQVFSDALVVALMVGLASLLCGAALFPVVVRLAADNQKKSHEVLASQAALIEGLRQSEMALEGKVSLRTKELEAEQTRTRDLLHNMLPREIAQELAATGSARPVRHEAVTILFTDFSDFTQAASTMPPDRMVAELNDIFAHFDQITDQCGVEKIKTIGDAYMAAAGVPSACPDHAQRCVKAGLRMLDYLAQRNQTSAFKWSLRVGVHTGPVVAGVVGTKKFAFDIWGDTVNIASRMESSGEVGRVNISAYTYDLVRNQFECTYRGKVDAKGKGQVDMYFVIAEVVA